VGEEMETMTFTVNENDPTCKTCGWILGYVVAETKEEALEKAKLQFKPKHKGTIWVQYPSDFLNKHARVRI
jgi:hypothetical protein